MMLRTTLALTFVALTIYACGGQTVDVGSEKTAPSSQADTNGPATGASAPSTASDQSSLAPYSGKTTSSAQDVDCNNYTLPGMSYPPDSIVGTWLVESVDDTASGTGPGHSVHYTIDQARPVMAVRFDADGSWHSFSCGDEDYSSCHQTFCTGNITCNSGSYKLDSDGELDTGPNYLENYGNYRVFSTPNGISIENMWATLEWANLVKIDTQLPQPCN